MTETRDNSHEQPPSHQPLIRLRDVVKDYPSSAGPVRALDSINLDIYPGELIGVIGRSGAGKTTLVNMVSGTDTITSGEVIVDGLSIHQLGESKLALWRGRNMGVIYQSFQLLPGLNLLDNVMLPMDFCGTFQRRRSRDRALELLRDVELEEHAYKRPYDISGGQQQRVAIARALANDPKILVADEPTGRLDSVTAETIFQVFEQLVRKGKTILMVTHDQSLAQRMDRVLAMIDGRLTGAEVIE